MYQFSMEQTWLTQDSRFNISVRVVLKRYVSDENV